jgi:hypothetical protein
MYARRRNRFMKAIEIDDKTYWNMKVKLFSKIATENGFDEWTEEAIRRLPCGIISLLIKVSKKDFPYTIKD